MLCTKVANKFFFFNYNLQFIEQERRRTGGKVATAGRLSLIKTKNLNKKKNKKMRRSVRQTLQPRGQQSCKTS